MANQNFRVKTGLEVGTGVTISAGIVTATKFVSGSDTLINGLNIGIGSGQVSSNTSIGFSALYSNTNGSQNTTNGYQNLFSNTQGSNNTASGYQALYSNQTANYNVAVGAQALFSNISGGGNVAIGGLSLYLNSTGYNNTATGWTALYSNTTGIDNTAIGNQTLGGNTTGWYNSAIGSDALGFNTTGSNNTSSGFQSLYFNTTGNNNVANGFQSLLSNVSGSFNVAVGYQAGYGVTGSNNVLIGPAAGSSSNPTYQPPIPGGSNQLVIGAGNTAWIYGNSSYNIGIGTTNPKSNLHVVGSGTTTLLVEGNARITGILTIGTSSVTLDGTNNQVNVGAGVTIHHTNGVQVGGNTLHSTGLNLNALSVSGISTITTLQGTTLKNYGETVNNIGNTGTAATINLANGNFVTATLTGNCTFTFTTGLSSGAISFTLLLTNDATPGRSIIWPAAVKWPGSSVPVRTTSANATDIYTFFTLDNGTNWYGSLSLYNYA